MEDKGEGQELPELEVEVKCLPEEIVSIVENHFQEHNIKDICRNAHLKTLTHMYKITSIHLKIRKKKIVKSTFQLQRFLKKNQGTMRMTVL